MVSWRFTVLRTGAGAAVGETAAGVGVGAGAETGLGLAASARPRSTTSTSGPLLALGSLESLIVSLGGWQLAQLASQSSVDGRAPLSLTKEANDGSLG